MRQKACREGKCCEGEALQARRTPSHESGRAGRAVMQQKRLLWELGSVLGAALSAGRGVLVTAFVLRCGEGREDAFWSLNRAGRGQVARPARPPCAAPPRRAHSLPPAGSTSEQRASWLWWTKVYLANPSPCRHLHHLSFLALNFAWEAVINFPSIPHVAALQ